MNPDNTIATIQPTSLWICGTGPAQQPQPQQQQNTAATICTQYGCQPPQQQGGHAGHQHQNTLATVCTQYGCPPPAAQAAGNQQAYTMHGATVCTQFGCQPQQNVNVSVPPHCPTVAPMCPPPAYGGGQAQAQFPTWPIGQCTVGVMTAVVCPPQQGQQAQQSGDQPAQGSFPQTMTTDCFSPAFTKVYPVTHGPVCPTYVCNQTWPSPMCGGGPMGGAQAQGLPHTSLGCVVQPHTFAGCQPTQSVAGCTTIASYTHNPPMCPPPPANMGGQAQAQFPTWPPAQCTHALTSLFGCAPQQGQPQQGVFPTLTCPAPQGQGQKQQALPHTMFPPLCNVGGGNTGAHTLFGCTTVTSTPTTPSTHFPGCTGVTATPATVGHTHLMGCTTVTSTPHTYSGGCPPVTISPTHLMGCTTVTSTPTTQAQMQGSGGQAGTISPTYHPAGGCGPVAPAANAYGGQAQAQMPTIPVISCAATAAGICTGVWPLC